MKHILFAALLLISLRTVSQVVADPALNQMRIASTDDLTLDVSALPIENIIRLKVPVLNKNFLNNLPGGSCKIKIGLGSKMVLDPAFNLATMSTSNYFQWSVAFFGGQIQLTGDLIAPLPANYADSAIFNVKGSVLGSSTITTNFLVTNHNTSTVLSDEDPTNNTSFLAYTITQGPIPVTFTRIVATREGCDIQVNFDAEREINVSHYEIEVSKDGTNFEKMGSLAANNLLNYKFRFPITESIKAQQLFVRVRSVDQDGKFQFSETRKVSASCDSQWGLIIYPNPVAANAKTVSLQTTGEYFNGKYHLIISDMNGKKMQSMQLSLQNMKEIKLNTSNLASGQYVLSVQNQENKQFAVLPFQKL